ncbi:MAG: RGCVC family protein [Pseudonocardia sp.]
MPTEFGDSAGGLDHDGAAAGGDCPDCGHDWSQHGVIAARYCRATHDRALQRACICSSADAAEVSRSPMYGHGRFSGR